MDGRLWLVWALAAVAANQVQGETLFLVNQHAFNDRQALRFGQDNQAPSDMFIPDTPGTSSYPEQSTAEDPWIWIDQQFDILEALQRQLLPPCPFHKEARDTVPQSLTSPALLAHMAAADVTTFSTLYNSGRVSTLRIVFPVRSRFSIKLLGPGPVPSSIQSEPAITFQETSDGFPEDNTEAAVAAGMAEPGSNYVSFDDMAAQRAAAVRPTSADDFQLSWNVNNDVDQLNWGLIIFVSLTVGCAFVWASLLWLCCKTAALPPRRTVPGSASIEQPLLNPLAQEGPAAVGVGKPFIEVAAVESIAGASPPQLITIQYVPLAGEQRPS